MSMPLVQPRVVALTSVMAQPFDVVLSPMHVGFSSVLMLWPLVEATNGAEEEPPLTTKSEFCTPSKNTLL